VAFTKSYTGHITALQCCGKVQDNERPDKATGKISDIKEKADIYPIR
jgi:hypothetical protein